jgi:hypothetical protein
MLIELGLRLYDLAALDAVGADANALAGTLNEGVHGLEIWAPATAGDVVGVRDVIAKLRAFAAKIAYLCHCPTPESLKVSLTGIGAVAKYFIRRSVLCALSFLKSYNAERLSVCCRFADLLPNL